MRPDSNYLEARPAEILDVARRHPTIVSHVALFRLKLNVHATPEEWLPSGHCETCRDSNYLDKSLNGKKVALRGAIIAIASCNLGFEVVT